MSSYKPPFPRPQTTSYPPPQPPAQPEQPPPPPPQHMPNQFPPIYPYPSQQFQPPSQQNFSQHYPPPPHHSYPFQPPPPPPESSYSPPPPPPQPQSKYTHSGLKPPLPPLPPSADAPPPTPPGSPPPKESAAENKGRREHHHNVGRQQQHLHQQRPNVGHSIGKKPVASGRVESEEERRMRKKREYEKQRQEEMHRQHMKESQNAILQKSQMLASQQKGHGHGHGSAVGTRMADRRPNNLLGAENRLKKPTTFLCKMKFRNELPDPSAQLKWMPLQRDPDRYTRYTITSLEKMHKPQLYVEPDIGIPLDLLDLSVYNRPAVPPPLDPEDEELLRSEDEEATPVKKNGIKKKDRPTDKGVSWLVKTQYISSLSADSTKQSLTEKQAKELREMKEGRNILENLNDRERKIKAINASFKACKLPPVHSTNKNLHAIKTFPFFPNFVRYDDKFVLSSFDGGPTADSEIYSNLDPSIRDACESQAIMKAYGANTSDPNNPEKIMSYMAPNPDELSKDMFDEDENRDYKWIREYNWEVRGDDANDPTNYLVSFDDNEARYLPFSTKFSLRKRRREGRSCEEVEQHLVPSKVTVRRRATAATRELGDSGNTSSRVNTLSSRKGSLDVDDDGLRRRQDVEHSAGSDEDMSE